ncbi:MAG: VPLPA-CTERM sorting domain-containing protein [Gammaproteobacteria bacterium]|nr:VPLPA-CTERM sorting domain-containing protein [Gammaproteobacteria bacterium]
MFGASVNIDSAVIPLPAAIWFMIGGLGTLLGYRRKK